MYFAGDSSIAIAVLALTDIFVTCQLSDKEYFSNMQQY